MQDAQEPDKYNLQFISDCDLFEHVRETVESYRTSIDFDLTSFNKNIVDPVKLTFDYKVYKKDLQTLIDEEMMMQIDKANNNSIGYFHQNIFRYVGGGWSVPSYGFDIENVEENIFVEMKNKHNTINSSSSQKTYIRMQDKIMVNPNAKCLLVEVIAEKSQNIPWVVSLDGKRVRDDRIRRVSIDKFYEIVTGDRFAFVNLCRVLPKVIDDVLKRVELGSIHNRVFDEPEKLSPNILKSIFLLAFSGYEGFDQY